MDHYTLAVPTRPACNRDFLACGSPIVLTLPSTSAQTLWMNSARKVLVGKSSNVSLSENRESELARVLHRSMRLSRRRAGSSWEDAAAEVEG